MKKGLKQRVLEAWALSMTKGRNTTRDEPIAITKFTIARGKDYKKTMKKYKEKGQEGLRDRRGRQLKKMKIRLINFQK